MVLTDYTNKTYRVDDVVFDQNPASTFEGRNNEKIDYITYYQKKYGIRIRDVSVSRSVLRIFFFSTGNKSCLKVILALLIGISFHLENLTVLNFNLFMNFLALLNLIYFDSQSFPFFRSTV